MGLSLANINPRALAARLIGLGAMITFMLALYTYSSQSSFKFRLPDLSIFSQRKRSSCPPDSWNNGQWEYKPRANLTAMTKKEDALEFAGFESCASDREFFWHLASDVEEQWGRWPKVSSYVWKPSDDCTVRPLDGSAMLKDMVEQGGWLLMGGMFEILRLSCFFLKSHQTRSPKATSFLFPASCTHMSVQPQITPKTHTSTEPGRKTST